MTTFRFENQIHGRPFKVALRASGYTLASFAKRIGLSMSLVEKWSRGAKVMGQKRREQVERILAKGPVDFVGMNPQRKRAPRSYRTDHGPCLGCSGDPAAFRAMVGEVCCACHGTGRRPGGSPPVQGSRVYSLTPGEVGD